MMSTHRISPMARIYLPELILHGLSLVLWKHLPSGVEFLCEGLERAAWTDCGLGVLDKIEDANIL
jgi:hypothetical protein